MHSAPTRAGSSSGVERSTRELTSQPNPPRTHSCSASSSGVVAICGGSIPRSDDEASERSDGKIRYQRVGHADVTTDGIASGGAGRRLQMDEPYLMSEAIDQLVEEFGGEDAILASIPYE